MTKNKHVIAKCGHEVTATVSSNGEYLEVPDCCSFCEGEQTDPHKSGYCVRFACGETCIGCGDNENGSELR